MSTTARPAPGTNDPALARPGGTAAGRVPYWGRLVDEHGQWRGDGARGEDLAALRAGIDRDPGSVPAMWWFYTRLREDGWVTADLRAEHLALTLFGVHQQSRSRPMHHRGIGVGSALLALRRSGKFSPEAVDRRVTAAATATSLTEAGVHLRGLITQLRGIDQPLDYDLLLRDLRDWQSPDRLGVVRRRWGGQYFAPAPATAVPADRDTGAGPDTGPEPGTGPAAS